MAGGSGQRSVDHFTWTAGTAGTTGTAGRVPKSLILLTGAVLEQPLVGQNHTSGLAFAGRRNTSEHLAPPEVALAAGGGSVEASGPQN